MPLVFRAGNVASPTVLTFPIGNSLVPYLMLPCAARIPWESSFWSSEIDSPTLRVASVQLRRFLGNVFNNNEVVEEVLGWVPYDATVFFHRRNPRLPPFQVDVGPLLFAGVSCVAMVTVDDDMSRDLFNAFLAHGTPRDGQALQNLLTH